MVGLCEGPSIFTYDLKMIALNTCDDAGKGLLGRTLVLLVRRFFGR